MRCEECDATLWRAGEPAPPGNYVRIDSPVQDVITLSQGECLPATFDGHIAIYRPSGRACCRTCTPSSNLQLTGDQPIPTEERYPHHDDTNPTITRRTS